VCYHEGNGVKRDDKMAVKLYRLAAAQGDTMAQYNLGLCYKGGDGVKKDLGRAAGWFRRAAKAGHRKARDQLKEIGC
jgi:uncharacterized protein